MESADTVNYVRLGDVMTAIVAERVRQDAAWGAAHDYGHSGIEWAGIITRYAGRVASDGLTVEQAQDALIKAAATCVAAIQAMALWSYGPNASAALNALQAEIKAASDAK